MQVRFQAFAMCLVAPLLACELAFEADGITCALDSDCPAEATCLEGRCRPCPACADGETCALGGCLPRDCPAQTCASGQACIAGTCADRDCFGVACAAGERCASGVCTACGASETRCADGSDDDCDGRLDCGDPDCLDAACGASGACGREQCSAAGRCELAVSPLGTACRPAAGPCDLAENCDGAAVDCPPDQVTSALTECRAAAGICDVAESCDGLAVDCGTDVRAASTVVCRASTEVCDAEERCDGAMVDCPADARVTGRPGAGTEDDPYLLCGAAQLLALMNPASADEWKAAYVLGEDLDLAGYDQASAPPVRPIGDAAAAFTGVFDGAGHTISNLTFVDEARDSVGLFGRVSGSTAVVRNVRLSGVNVRGLRYVGGLVGWLQRGATVMNSSTTGTVGSVEHYVGGLVGMMGHEWASHTGRVPVTVSSSWSAATVSNAGSNVSFAGGLVGNIGNNGFCLNSYATGAVQAGLDFGGGLAGGNNGTILNCFATGDVRGAASIGGLVGSSGDRIVNCFALGNVTGNNGAYTGALVGDDWGAVTNSHSWSGATCTASSGACNPPTNGETVHAQLADFSDRGAEPLLSWNFSSIWTPSAGLPQLTPAFLDRRAWGDCAAHANDRPFAGGAGTLENPYLICTPEQLGQIGLDTAGLALWRAYRLMADLDLAGSAPAGLPIGNGAAPFTGFFDGNGKSISRMALTSAMGNDVGLFGTFTGIVRRLGIINADVRGAFNREGVLVGELLETGSVLDCYGTGIVEGESTWIGGLVGNIQGNSVVVDSYFAGSVRAGNAGGLAGRGTGVDIENCFTSADVTGLNTGGPLSTEPVDANSWYDASRTCTGCAGATGTPAAATSWFYDRANAPLSTWDFDHVWQGSGTALPTLR